MTVLRVIGVPRKHGMPVMRMAAFLGCLLGVLAGCASPEAPSNTQSDRSVGDKSAANRSAGSRSTTAGPATQNDARNEPQSRTGNDPAITPRIVRASRKLQCVPYARRHVDIALRGEAWTWWNAARGRYDRGRQPQTGSLLVLKQRGNSRGHLAVVTRIVGPREIIVNHANWLNRGRIHLGTPVRDVSAGNDWSAVRVWYTPGKTWGRSIRPAYGFIYPGLKDS